MKKLFSAALLILVIGSSNLKAQTVAPKVEFDLSYGAGNVSEFIHIFGAVLGTAITCGAESIENLDCSGALGVEAYFAVANRLSIGALLSAETFSADQKITINGNEQITKYNSAMVAAMPMLKFTYFNHPHFGLYSKAGAGVLWMADTDEQGNVEDDITGGFMFNISPIGFDFGGRVIRGFYELNVGTKGLMNFGVRFAF